MPDPLHLTVRDGSFIPPSVVGLRYCELEGKLSTSISTHTHTGDDDTLSYFRVCQLIASNKRLKGLKVVGSKKNSVTPTAQIHS